MNCWRKYKEILTENCFTTSFKLWEHTISKWEQMEVFGIKNYLPLISFCSQTFTVAISDASYKIIIREILPHFETSEKLSTFSYDMPNNLMLLHVHRRQVDLTSKYFWLNLVNFPNIIQVSWKSTDWICILC